MIPKIKPYKKLIYLDHAATTPVDPAVLRSMTPFWSQSFGNPSSLYKLGVKARLALTQARKSIASIMRARPEEIIFTAGATESINLAFFGFIKAIKKKVKNPHIIISAIEHDAVLKAAEELTLNDCTLTILPVNRQGFISFKDLKASINPQTVLISIMYANNEIGTIEPIQEIGKWLQKLNKEREGKHFPHIYFHTDASQAAGYLELNVHRLGVDLLSLNGSKIYGPKQTGILFAKKNTPLSPLIYGGGQENNLRSGTENVAGFIGLAKAIELAQKNLTQESKKQTKLRDYLLDKITKLIPESIVRGPIRQGNNPDTRLPNNLSITFPGVDGEALILYLDSYNIAVSTGSACSEALNNPSHVLLAIGATEKEARSTIRFSLGKTTTKTEIDFLLKLLPPLLVELKNVAYNM